MPPEHQVPFDVETGRLPSAAQSPQALSPTPPRKESKEAIGPIVGAAIVVMLLIFGGLYFWGARLNHQNDEPLPLITGDISTTTSQ